MADDKVLTVGDLIKALAKLPIDTEIHHYSALAEPIDVRLTRDNQSKWTWLRLKRIGDYKFILYTDYDAEQCPSEPLDFSWGEKAENEHG